MNLKLLTPLALALAILGWSCLPAAAKGYRTSVGTGEDTIPVVVVAGTPYEMGRSLGELLKEEIDQCMGTFFERARMADPGRINDDNLDRAWESISPFVDPRFAEEVRGMAEGAGIDYATLLRGQMIPVVSDYACSGVAVWGEATRDGHLYQIRNLDFTMQGGLQDFPVLVVYLPNQGIPHILPTFAGAVGANTGLNAKGIALSEKGGSPKSEYPFNLKGDHFSTRFREVLYDADSLGAAVDLFKADPLIKRYHIYVGDGTGGDRGAVKIRVSEPDPVKLNVWTDSDPSDELAPRVMDNAIYFTMDNDKCFEDLKAKIGTYDAESMIALSKSLSTDDGSLLTVVYDATDLELWVAYAAGMEPAKSRPYVHVRLDDYLDVDKAPEGALKVSGF